MLLDMLDRYRYRRISVKRHTAGQHLKQRDTQRIDITLFIGKTAPYLLRGSIMHTAHDIGSNGIAGCCLRNAEVRYLYLAVHADDHVLRLDITVNDMIVVRRLDPLCHLDRNAHSFSYGKPRFLLDIFLQGNAFYQLHDNIMRAVFLSHIIDINDIRMHQSCCRLCFTAEFLQEILVFRKFLL